MYLVRNLCPEYIKENSYDSKVKNNNNPVKRQINDLNGYFTKEHIQRANKRMERFSTSLVVKEMQIKTRCNFTLTRVVGL